MVEITFINKRTLRLSIACKKLFTNGMHAYGMDDIAINCIEFTKKLYFGIKIFTKYGRRG